jgi:pullulanase
LPDQKVFFHYHRFDGEYEGVSIWFWNAQPGVQGRSIEVFPSRQDDFGAVFEVNLEAFGFEAALDPVLGFIPRRFRSWEHRDGGDRLWRPHLGSKVWLMEGHGRIFTEQPFTGCQVLRATLDTQRIIHFSLSEGISENAIKAEAVWVESPGRRVDLSVLRSADNEAAGHVYHLVGELEEPIDDFGVEWTLHTAEWGNAPLQPRGVLFTRFKPRDDEWFGARLDSGCTRFRLFAPTASSVEVVLFDTWDGGESRRLAMAHGGNGIWQARVEESLEGNYYAYDIRVPHHGATGRVIDPWAVNTVGRGDRALLTNPRGQDPPHFRPVRRPESAIHPTDAIIYEVSVRDFTISPTSGVQQRGKFHGMAERGTQCEGMATGIDHLKELGVTHVQLLPIQDFDNDEQNPAYNWGYMTAHFNSPEGIYATDIKGPARIAEFKQLVKALHEAGIGVILDVVYNHTGTQNTLEAVAPGYYLRQRLNGELWNGSGTGNEFHSEAPFGRHFIIESCKYWVEEYGIDGFRFDLMALIDLDTMKTVRRELLDIHPHLLIYGEPWMAAGSGVHLPTDKSTVRGTGIGAFNDHYRNALKGEPDNGSPGYVQAGCFREEVRRGIAGSIDDWTTSPVETVNYATCHDNLCLWDKLAVSTNGADEESRIRMQMLTFGILAVSQGILFLHGGEEFLRSKGGRHNTYDAGDEVNQFDWRLKRINKRVFDFHRGMIALRRGHPVLRLRSAEAIRRRLTWHDEGLPHPACIAFTLDANGDAAERWDRVLVLINPTRHKQVFPLLSGEVWSVHVSGDQVDLKGSKRVDGKFGLGAQSLALLAM